MPHRTRCWSTWNQFLTFLVGDGGLPGNPMAAVPRPRRVKAAPKPLQGEDTPETLLRSAALGRPNARTAHAADRVGDRRGR